MTKNIKNSVPVMQGTQAEALMRELSGWGNTTTIILHGGCVFEFKGTFPQGDLSEGFYNLNSHSSGFEGHINLNVIDSIAFQSRAHRGRESHAFIFQDHNGDAIFKVFLGRDTDGSLLPKQVEAFNKIQSNMAL